MNWLSPHNLADKIALVSDYDPRKTATLGIWPATVQAKLDGVRAVYFPGYGFVNRKGMRWDPARWAHIKIDDAELYRRGILALDGEFYVHGWPLPRINGATNVNGRGGPDELEIKYHPFDCILEDQTARYDDRLQVFQSVGWGSLYKKSNNVMEVRSMCANCWDVSKSFYRGITPEYEGIIIRDHRYPYTAGRTSGIWRVKATQDMDCKVLWFDEGEGKFAGMVGALEVKGENTQHFGCGGGTLTDEERREIWKKQTEYHGRICTVTYEKLSEDGIPLKPRFKCWKE